MEPTDDDDPRTLFEAAVSWARQGRHSEAIAGFQRVVALAPEVSVAYFNLANSQMALGQFDDARRAYRRAAELDPDADVYNNLGIAYAQLGRFDEAVTAFQDALRLSAPTPTLLSNLARAQSELAEWDAAIETLTQWIDLQPENANAQRLLGQAWLSRGDPDKAIPFFERAVELDPFQAQSHFGLGACRAQRGQLTQAQADYHKALELGPGDPRIVSNLGLLRVQCGDPADGIECYRRALRRDPSLVDAHSNLLHALLFLDSSTGASLRAEAEEWATIHLASCPRLPAVVHEPERRPRLRIGYLSADFLNHPIGYLVEPVIREHDRSRFEIFCYSNQSVFDDLSLRMYQLADHWKVISSLSDDAAARMIRDDAIDILVDLSGHTARHRLGVVARRPAAIQATWLGYSGTTGIRSIDYLIADPHLIPSGDEPQYVERIARLPEVYLCFDPPRYEMAVEPLPAERTGRVTFGSFNVLPKISPAVIRSWAEILRAVPDSRLLLRTKALGDKVVADHYRGQFAACGVSADRLIFRGEGTRRDVLATYHSVDVGLDPFPFTGCATTLEALWMGVPVVTLRGNRFAGRIGTSLLRATGLEDWIADDPEDYVRRAVVAADNLPRLSRLRQQLRSKLMTSPIGARREFTRQLEQLFLSLTEGRIGAATTPGP